MLGGHMEMRQMLRNAINSCSLHGGVLKWPYSWSNVLVRVIKACYMYLYSYRCVLWSGRMQPLLNYHRHSMPTPNTVNQHRCQWINFSGEGKHIQDTLSCRWMDSTALKLVIQAGVYYYNKCTVHSLNSTIRCTTVKHSFNSCVAMVASTPT